MGRFLFYLWLTYVWGVSAFLFVAYFPNGQMMLGALFTGAFLTAVSFGARKYSRWRYVYDHTRFYAPFNRYSGPPTADGRMLPPSRPRRESTGPTGL